MRFYQSDWLTRLLRHIEANPNRILCAQTIVLIKDEDGKVIQESPDCISYGAHINFIELDRLFEPRWSFHKYENILSPSQFEQAGLSELPLLCILGAAYVFSKDFWKQTGGLVGLREYGLDESYLSIKSWLMGIAPVLVEDVYIGHIYRKSAPYSITKQSQINNTLLLALLLLPYSYIKGYLSAKSFVDIKKATSDLFKLQQPIDWIITERERLLGKGKMEVMEQIISMNTQAFLMEHAQKDQDSLIESITAKIVSKYYTLEDFGLYSGRLGCILYLLIYSSIQKNRIIRKIAEVYTLEAIQDILQKKCSDPSILFDLGWFLIYTTTYSLITTDIQDFIHHIDDILSKTITTGKLRDNGDLQRSAELYFEGRLYIKSKEKIPEEIERYLNKIVSEKESISNFFRSLSPHLKSLLNIVPSLFDISYFYVPPDLNITRYELGLSGLSGIGVTLLRFFQYETKGNFNH